LFRFETEPAPLSLFNDELYSQSGVAVGPCESYRSNIDGNKAPIAVVERIDRFAVREIPPAGAASEPLVSAATRFPETSGVRTLS